LITFTILTDSFKTFFSSSGIFSMAKDSWWMQTGFRNRVKE
jgi:hypothetical protein